MSKQKRKKEALSLGINSLKSSQLILVFWTSSHYGEKKDEYEFAYTLVYSPFSSESESYLKNS